MQFSGSRTICVCSVLALCVAAEAQADPGAELARFSVFEQVDLNKLASGKAMTARGPTLDFPRDLSVQAVYVVQAPLRKTSEMHKDWDPTRHPELKVYLHGDISSKPALSDFARIGSAPNNAAIRALAAVTQK